MRRVLAAAGLVRDEQSRFLLVQRGTEPELGRWTVPGGRLHPGENLRDAVVREVREETGIDVTVGAEVWSLELPCGDGVVYEIHDFFAAPIGGALRAGDDATDAGWFTVAQMAELELTEDLLGYFHRAGVIPGPGEAGRSALLALDHDVYEALGRNDARTLLPGDSHVHTEWSWDAAHGSMERTCEQAMRLGLQALAFTEHADYTPWMVTASDLSDAPHLGRFAQDGTLTPPTFDVSGYFETVDRCRARFPDLRILTGLELGEPHWHTDAVTQLLAAGEFDRVLGSLHCLPLDQRYAEPPQLYKRRPPKEVVRDYLAEATHLILTSDQFEVFAHIDYPLRYWPAWTDPFQPRSCEDEFRDTLRALAHSGRALEVNTASPRYPDIVRWWHAEGGEAVSFGSDAHTPNRIAHDFANAAAMVEACGFRPSRNMHDFWIRR